MGVLWQDLCYAIQMLIKRPGFAAVAILTLALGVGANTAIFSLINAVMLRDLPVENPSQLVLLSWSMQQAPRIHSYMSSGDCPTKLDDDGPGSFGCSFSELIFRKIAQADVFSGVGAFANSNQLALSGNGLASAVNGQLVSGDFFRTIGLKAAAGRLVELTDDAAAATPVAVLSYGYWKRAFGGSRNAVGRVIQLNKVPFTIVGVTESRFTGIAPGTDYDVWLPLSCAQSIHDAARQERLQSDQYSWWLTIIGRLKPGAQRAQVQAVVSGLFRNEMLHGSAQIFDDGEVKQTPAPADRLQTLAAAGDNLKVTLAPAQTGLTGDRGLYAHPLYVLMLGVGIILVIVCANVAGLMLARATARKKEMAVRMMLGAGRLRIVRQLLTESVLLSVLGGAFGVLFAYCGVRAIISLVPSNHPARFAMGIDTRVLGFTISVSLLTGILVGIAPAFRSIRTNLNPALKESEHSSASSRFAGGKWFSVGNELVVAQVALAVVVLVSAGLLVRTLARLRSVDIGFDAQNMLSFGVNPTLLGYKSPQLENLYRDLQVRLSKTPGVQSVSYSSYPLLSNALDNTFIHWVGTPQDEESEVDLLRVGPDFFSTMRIPFLAGRNFNSSDFKLPAAGLGANSSSAPTPVIVNHRFLDEFLGKENPLGKRFGDRAANARLPGNPRYEIVGVVRDTKFHNLRREIRATMYEPGSSEGASFELRITAHPQTILPAIRNVVAQVDANLPLLEVTTESEQIDRLLFRERLVAWLSGFFGLLALALACIGLYGLLSYEVSLGTREIGIRMALGAQRENVLRLVLRQGVTLTIVGTLVGAGVALGLTRYLNSMLYGVQTNDPFTMIGAAFLLTVVALAACYIPARRATCVDPMVALRHE
jgi:predicted permease